MIAHQKALKGKELGGSSDIIPSILLGGCAEVS
jgi:hypothetical protein